jgi:hypothetical protein
MSKSKIDLKVVPLLLLGLGCIILALNTAGLNSQLKKEKLDVKILGQQLKDLQINYDNEVRSRKDLESSAAALREEAQALKANNAELENRLNSALEALQGSEKVEQNKE